MVELLTSGTLVFLNPSVIDRFMVGGGSSGGSPQHSEYGAKTGLGGGAGGRTRTDKNITVDAGVSIPVTIGAGGVATWSGVYGSYSAWVAGGATSWGSDTVAGGDGAVVNNANAARIGRNGGSGGGGAGSSTSTEGIGGSDGGNGTSSTGAGGTGQGLTTREFSEPNGKLYAAGGGGGMYIEAQTPVYAQGGEGGGGAGAWSNGTNLIQAAGAGMPNSGSGGGGGILTFGTVFQVMGGSGGSGIVCFRASAE